MNVFERISLLMLLASAVLVGCQDDRASSGVQEKAPAATSPGKPSAPVSMEYEVLGNPVVGQPVAINIEISSPEPDTAVTLQYSITDQSAVVFQQGQVLELEYPRLTDNNVSQLWVIPQREGRVYVNVSAEVLTEGGSMIRSMAIPIRVGSAPEQPTIDGELREGPDGETVISMPAQEN